jgi:hypothetical protein
MRGRSGAFLRATVSIWGIECPRKAQSVEGCRGGVQSRAEWWRRKFERQFNSPSNSQAWVRCGRRMRRRAKDDTLLG